MASLLIPAALATLPFTSAFTIPTIFDTTCSSPADSCSSSAESSDACCVNRPGGLFLQPQFWDTDPVTGPDDSWTIHGLWPDNCDGTFEENCDSSREYSDLTSILESNGKSSLVSYMKEYWQSNNGSPESFWDHEWSTHGTCVSTLDPGCYTDYSEGQEAADYFQVAVDLFKTLDTYSALSAAGITPSSSKTYTSAEILDALESVTGKAAIISCSSGELYQVYYGFYVNGPLQNADFIPTKVVGQSSNCPSTGVKYLPKNGNKSPSNGSVVRTKYY